MTDSMVCSATNEGLSVQVKDPRFERTSAPLFVVQFEAIDNDRQEQRIL